MYLGLSEDKLRFHDHEKLAHYAKEACDIEYKFPFGWGEIMVLIIELIMIYQDMKNIVEYNKDI